MVREVTVIGQLEFCSGIISLSFFLLLTTRRRRGGNVEIRVFVFAGFPSPVEGVGNSSLLLEFSTLSTGRHFHRAQAWLFRSASTPV